MGGAGAGRRAPGPDLEGGRPRAAPKCGYMGAWASARGRLGVWACTGARLVRAAGSRRCAGGARVDSGGSASCLKMTYRDGQQSTFVPPRDAELAVAAGAVVDPRVTKKRAPWRSKREERNLCLELSGQISGSPLIINCGLGDSGHCRGEMTTVSWHG